MIGTNAAEHWPTQRTRVAAQTAGAGADENSHRRNGAHEQWIRWREKVSDSMRTRSGGGGVGQMQRRGARRLKYGRAQPVAPPT